MDAVVRWLADNPTAMWIIGSLVFYAIVLLLTLATQPRKVSH